MAIVFTSVSVCANKVLPCVGIPWLNPVYTIINVNDFNLPEKVCKQGK